MGIREAARNASPKEAGRRLPPSIFPTGAPQVLGLEGIGRNQA